MLSIEPGEVARRFAGVGDAHRLVAQRQDAVGVAQKVMAHRRQAQALFFADKQIGAQLLSSWRSRVVIRRHAVQLLGGAGDRAGFRHAAEHAKLGQIHNILVS